MAPFLLLLQLLGPATDAHSLQADQSVQAPALELGDVQVAGTRRYTVEDVRRVSALEIGKRVTIADLDATAQRMAETGLFKSVGYRYTNSGDRMIVTFEIEEAEWTIPVVFDNFVWFTDAQVVASVRETVPSFDGTAPATAGIPELIAGALQRLLESKRIEGRVEFLPQAPLHSGVEGYLFRVIDPAPRLCALRFEGSSAIPDEDLAAALKPPMNDAYSRTFLISAAKGTLVDMYRRRGYWRAAFGEPVPALSPPKECTGVTVTIAVNEGAPYSWDSAAWVGNAALSSSDLDALLGMKSGEVAGVVKLDEALRRVGRVYATQGYLLQRASYTPRLDDHTRRAAFEIRIVEGPQFRLGAVDFVNLAATDAATLRKVWRIRPGDVYDASYPDQFAREEILPRLPRGSTLPRTETNLDVKKAIVNVRFVFGG